MLTLFSNSYTISCFFEYMIEIVIPDGQTREDYFISTTRMSRFRRRQRHNSGTYRWYKVARMFIYFGLFFVFVTQVLELILAAKVCHTSETYESVHTLLEILSIFFISWALIALLMTYSQFQPVYSELHLLRTFWVYKGIVLLYMIETFAITIIEAAGAAPPTRYMSEADFVWGVHAFMVACQSCIFSFGYVAMLSGLRYRQRRGYVQVSTSNKGPNFSVGRLLWAVAFPTEAFAGFWEALGTFFGLFRGRKGYDYTAGTGVGHEERVAKTDESDQGLNLGEGSTRYSNSPDQSGGA